MMRRFTSTERILTPRGVFAPYVAIIVLAVIIMCGFAVDTGHITLAKRKLGRAVDAAVISGARVYKSRDQAFLDQFANTTVEKNLEQMGLDPGIGQLFTRGQRIPNNIPRGGAFGPDLYWVRSTLNVDLFLMNIIPGFRRSFPVTMEAKSATLPMTLAMVLDLSGSMANEYIPCSPNTLPNGTCGPNPVDRQCSKLCELQKAAIRVVDLVDENADKLAIISFGSFLVVLKDIDSPIDKPALKVMITNLGSLGSTCIHCGLKEATSQLTRPHLASTLNKNIILMTDGTPNVTPTAPSVCGYDTTPFLYTPLVGYGNVTEERAVRFYQTLIEGYLAKINKIKLYSVGLGTYPARALPPSDPPLPCTSTDPYNFDCIENPDSLLSQGALDGAIRPNLLEQLANAKNFENYAANLIFTPKDGTTMPDGTPMPTDDECIAARLDPSGQNDPLNLDRNQLCACKSKSHLGTSLPRGQYFHAPQGPVLAAAFETIILSIREPWLFH